MGYTDKLKDIFIDYIVLPINQIVDFLSILL